MIDDYNEWRALRGLPPVASSDLKASDGPKRISTSVYITENSKVHLLELAAQFGYKNLSTLIEAIGSGTLKVVKP